MISSKALLTDLKKQLKLLQDDLRERAEAPDDGWGQRLKEQHRTALERGRTAHPWVTWRDGEVDQAAVAWLVATTFVRFCEDNDLLEGARDELGNRVATLWLAGPGPRLDRSVEHETEFFGRQPSANRRDWMHEAFSVLAAQSAGRALVDPHHSLVWKALISAEAADRLVSFWRATDADGRLTHDFTDHRLDTRFLGDLYQDLSDHAQKIYALWQTPKFVEEFILDQTLAPAVEEFGIEGLKVIDPTCGSGHFLLGAFARLDALWAERSPGLDVRERVRRAMDSVHGVDLNPFAVAIARFRLTVAGLQAAGLRSLVEAPEFGYHLAVGDSLLGAHYAQLELELGLVAEGDGAFQYDHEDLSEYHGILKEGQYHVVVGNPPYISVRDTALKRTYKMAYPCCHGLWTLAVPFLDLFFLLAVKGTGGEGAGYVGKITANAFMKREFGRKVIEELLAGLNSRNPVDLTHVIDSSGAYIPGHGTPTTILFGRRRLPQQATIRTVLGIKGEPGRPDEPSKGYVWSEITENLDSPGFEGNYVSIADAARSSLAHHPWSLSGGGAAELKELLDQAPERLRSRVRRMGMFGDSHAEDFFAAPLGTFRRLGLEAEDITRAIDGNATRDYWAGIIGELFYAGGPASTVSAGSETRRALWPWRTLLWQRATFSGDTYRGTGVDWLAWHQVSASVDTEARLVFAKIATHFHGALVSRCEIEKPGALRIEFRAGASDVERYQVLGLLNSSTACFWLKQVSHNKGNGGIGGGIGDEDWEPRYEFTGTKLQAFPLPAVLPHARGRRMDALAQALQMTSPRAVQGTAADESADKLSFRLMQARERWHRLRARMVFEQEELDWEVYRIYGLVDEDLTYRGSLLEDDRILSLGERAFEIALARKVADGLDETAWFERHGSTPITDLPELWPEDYRVLVERRLELIASDPFLGLLERPEFKRRWATPGWEPLLREALTDAVLDRLERRELWFDANGQPLPRSVAELADAVRGDTFVVNSVNALAGSGEVNLASVLLDLMKDEAVPYLAALRLKEPGIEKYREWQRVWELQRREDAGERVAVPVPPKYAQADFAKPAYWRARGKVDMPKERFISYPDVVRTGDNTPVIGWAGWDHAEQAQALAREISTQQALGAGQEQQEPLVAGLVELEPWLDRWHSEMDPRYGASPAAAIHQTVEHHAQQLGVTRADLDRWRLPVPVSGRRASTRFIGTKGELES